MTAALLGLGGAAATLPGPLEGSTLGAAGAPTREPGWVRTARSTEVTPT